MEYAFFGEAKSEALDRFAVRSYSELVSLELRGAGWGGHIDS